MNRYDHSSIRCPNTRSLSRLNCAILLTIPLCLTAIGCNMRQERFSTPEEAAENLTAAVRARDRERVRAILGREADDLLDSGDEVADQNTREKYLAAYDTSHSIVAQSDESMTLQVGADNWPMPIPIVKHRRSWRFDTRAGREEILNRRIGRNELAVQQVCLALVDAQREYITSDRNGDGVLEYAQKVISDPGMKNGLYWETAENEPLSPLGPEVADAAEEGYTASTKKPGQRRPFHGYYFKLLKAQGNNAPGGKHDYVVNGKMTDGFAVVAWPAIYDNSGVMTFMISHQGILYERDLGRRTHSIAESMTEFDPDSQWKQSNIMN